MNDGGEHRRRGAATFGNLLHRVIPASGSDLSTEHGRGQERTRRATMTSVSGVGSRLFSVAVSLVTIPILLRYLGVERYGIWLTISAGAAWLGLLQFGVAPSLINRLSSVVPGDQERQRRLASTAFWLALALGILAVAPLAVIYEVAAWAQIFNVPPGPLADEARVVVAVTWLGFALGLPFSIPTAILRARQEGYLANGIELAATASRLVLLLVLVAFDVGMVGIAIGLTAMGLVFSFLAAAYVYISRSPSLRPTVHGYDRSLAGALLKTGVSFTGLSVAALVISYTDLIVITQVLGPSSVPAYAIAFSFLSLFVSLELAILDAVWPAYSEAAAKGDRQWLTSTHRRLTVSFTFAAMLFGLLLVGLGQPLIRFWAGPDVVPPLSLLLTLGLLSVVQAYQLPHGRMLTALGHVRLNSLLGLGSAAINLPLSIALAQRFGITGVALGTLAGYLIVGVVLVVKARGAIAQVSAPRTSDLADSRTAAASP